MSLLWWVVVVLLVLWLAGVGLHIGGSLVHALIVIALIVLVVQIIRNPRA